MERDQDALPATGDNRAIAHQSTAQGVVGETEEGVRKAPVGVKGLIV